MSPYRSQTFRQVRFLGLFALLAAVFTATFAFGEQLVGYTPNVPFEERMKALKEKGHDCLPAPYPIQTSRYINRFASSLFDTCVSENASAEQIEKYAVLAAGSMTAAGVYVLPYTVSELKSDAVKCVLKAYVDTSSLSESDKAYYRGGIETGDKVKDWGSFIYSVPGLAAASAGEVAGALTKTALTGTKSASSIGVFSSAYNAVARGLSVRSLKELYWKESIVALDEYEYYLAKCEYADAQRSLVRAAEMADLECKALGHTYRVAEQELVSSIYQNYNALQLDPLNLSHNTHRVTGEQRSMKYVLAGAKVALETQISIVEDIDKRELEIKALAWQFEQDRQSYQGLYRDTLDALNTPHACYAISRLERDIDRLFLGLKTDPKSCRAALFRDGPGGRSLSPENFAQELRQVARGRSDFWWGEMSKIRDALNNCETSRAFAIRDQLRSDMSGNPIFNIIDGQCVEAEQSPTLVAALKAVAEPAHCEMVAVPKGIIGLTVPEAEKLLAVAKLYFAGPVIKVEPKEGDKPGTIIDSQPSPGSKLRVWSGVGFTVYDDAPEEEPDAELVDVPTVIGMTEAEAVNALAAVGLTAAYADEIPADREEMVPGNIHAASHILGDKLPKGSAVTLTKIGDRPTVMVPSIVGAKTPEEAQGILAGVKLAIGRVIEGDTAPEGSNSGEFYATDPPIDSPVKMFSSVAPIRYANLRPVPSVLEKSPTVAIGMVNKGGFFKVGNVSPGKPVKEDEKPGVIQTVTPGVGTPSPKGTVLDMTVSMPLVVETVLPEADAVSNDGNVASAPPPAGEDINNLRKIPRAIIDMPAGRAADILRGADGFFEVPKPRDGGAAQDGQTVGNVQSSTPAPGTMAQRGSIVQLYIYTEAAQQTSLQACPAIDPNPRRTSHEFDSNNNPNDKTFLYCLYFDDGRLSNQIPYTDDRKDGIWLQYQLNEHCGRFLTKTETHAKDILLEEANYACDPNTGEAFLSSLRIHANGSLISETRYQAKGVRSSHTDFVSGHRSRVLSYDEKGMQRGCRQLGSDGRMHKCGL